LAVPAWLPSALGLALFWALIVFVLRLVFRRPEPEGAAPPFEETVPAPMAAPEPVSVPEPEPVPVAVPEAGPPAAPPPAAPEPRPPRPAPRAPRPAPPRAPAFPTIEIPDRLPFALRHRRLVAASRRLAARQQNGG
jgi:hypothetical protein